MEKEKFIYKIVIYNEANHSLYTLELDEKHKNPISKRYIRETYFNKTTNVFKRLFDKDNTIVYHDIVGQLIDYHTKYGNDNYVEKLSSHVFHNKIVMCYDNLVEADKKNEIFPWDYNAMLYQMFLSDEMKVSQQIVFVAEDQFDNNNTFTPYEYSLFYDDVKALIGICCECANEFERKKEYNKLLESDENKITYKYPESITIHYGINRDLKIRDLGQVADWVENTMFDDNYYKDHIRTEVKDSSTVMQIKAGAMYIGDPNTGIVDVYLSSPGTYKSKYKN